MPALDSASLLIEVGNLWIGDDEGSAVDLGAVRKVHFTGKLVRTKIDSDNRGTILHKVRMEGMISFDWLEPGDPAKMENLYKGIIALSTTAGSIVNNHVQVVAAGDWAYDTFIPFDHQNYSAGVIAYPNVDSVTMGTDGAIILNTDYVKTFDENTQKWGITIRDSSTVTTLAQQVSIQFDYTPLTALVLTGGTNQTATPRFAMIVGPSEDNDAVTRTLRLASCTASSDMLLAYVDVESAGDVGVMPVTLEGDKGTTWEYTDQVNPT